MSFMELIHVAKARDDKKLLYNGVGEQSTLEDGCQCDHSRLLIRLPCGVHYRYLTS